MEAKPLHYLNMLSPESFGDRHFYRVKGYSSIYNSAGSPSTGSFHLISNIPFLYLTDPQQVHSFHYH